MVLKRLVVVSLLILITTLVLFPQTQLMKVGNAVQYWYDTSPGELRLTIGSEHINGKEYFKRKISYYPWLNTDYYQLSFERIKGDSLYFILGSDNSDSLIFNYNWKPGTIIQIDSAGNSIYFERIDSVKIETTFLPNDTVYYVGLFGVNSTTGDTLPRLPQLKRVYKKFGVFDMGVWGYMEGVKIDGVRYGAVYPFPEEVRFSGDSIFVPAIGDTSSILIINNSDYELRIDSVISVGSFYGYRGWFALPQSELWFYIYRTFPNDWTDTLGIIIPPHDSVKVSFYEVDLCPICESSTQDYFIDTLQFVFTFKYYQNYEYEFSKSIQISGEGHPSIIQHNDPNPNEFSLHQNFPNPFNPNTKIQYTINSRQFVIIKVNDMLGKEVVTLVNEEKNTGAYEINFDASSLSSGIYFYQLRADSFIQTKKMVFLR
jgi:hypothetical protein